MYVARASCTRRSEWHCISLVAILLLRSRTQLALCGALSFSVLCSEQWSFFGSSDGEFSAYHLTERGTGCNHVRDARKQDKTNRLESYNRVALHSPISSNRTDSWRARILCFVYTTAGYHDSKARAVKETW